jgi:hypothetical protein
MAGGQIAVEVRSRIAFNITEAALDATLAGLGVVRLLQY